MVRVHALPNCFEKKYAVFPDQTIETTRSGTAITKQECT